jgi:hypothetical protein
MKTIRVQYSGKQDLDSGLSKVFATTEGKLVSKTENCHVVFIDENTVDLLVPDDFIPTLVDGTIVKPADDAVGHYFLGHEETVRVVDSTGKTEAPIKPQLESEPVEKA